MSSVVGSTREPVRLAIIGGGPAGLMTLYRLQQEAAASLAITLFEATNRTGGKIVTSRFESSPVAYEAGAAELYDYSIIGKDPLRELIGELGLNVVPLESGPEITDGQIVASDADRCRILGAPTCSALQGFRRRAKRLISPAEYFESDWMDGSENPLTRESFYEFLQTVPDEGARAYVTSLVHSDLATETHQTSAIYGLHNYLMNEPEYMRLYTVSGGLESISRELFARVCDRVRLSHRITRVEKTAKGGYSVEGVVGREHFTERFDIVVAALPNNWIPGIDWGAGTLARAMRTHHLHYDYPAHYLRVSFLFSEPFWRNQLKGSYFLSNAFGGCCIYDETSRYASSDFGVLGWLLAGEAALNLSNLADSGIITRVLESFPHCLKEGPDYLLEARVNRWVGSVNGWPGGNPARKADMRHTPDPVNNPLFMVTGDYLFDSTLNGVLDSVELVVDSVLDELDQLPEHAESCGAVKSS